MEGRDFEVRTGDGRRLLCRVAGPAYGALLVFHPGTPGSRFAFDGHLEQGAARGLRHVAWSRPGYDGSDRHPGRRFSDSAAETAAVADALGAERFYVAGASGGGPPALACAARMPERVIAAAAIASPAPRALRGERWMSGTGAVNRAEFGAVREGPAALEAYLRAAAAEMGSIETVPQLVEAGGDFFCAADRRCLTGRFAEYQLVCQKRAVRGGIWGWFDDDVAMVGDWGFELAEIAVPVSIWQGRDDGIVPAAEAECLAAHIPTARPHILRAEGHLSILHDHYAAMLDDLFTTRP